MATKYVILRQGNDTESWFELGTAEAGNDLSAVREFLGKGENAQLHGAGKYRAVPKRSWPDDPHDLKPQISFR